MCKVKDIKLLNVYMYDRWNLVKWLFIFIREFEFDFMLIVLYSLWFFFNLLKFLIVWYFVEIGLVIFSFIGFNGVLKIIFLFF